MSKTYPAGQQIVVIGNSQNVSMLYKIRIKGLEKRIKELEARVEKLEAENKRLQQTKARNSRLSRENTILKQQVKELSTDLAEAYDAVGILNKRGMDNERHVRRDS